MRTVAFAIGALILLAVPTAASAKPYCCWNPAICNAVCGAKCCGASGNITSGGSQNYSPIPTATLKTEHAKAAGRGGNPDLARLLKAELDRRASSTLAAPK